MKKTIFHFIFFILAIILFSCSEEPELNNPFAGGSNSGITGNAIYFSPSYLEASSTTPFTIEVHIQEITNLVGAEIEFSYDKDLVDFTSSSSGTLFLNVEESVLIEENNMEIGRVLLTMGIAQDEGVGLSENGSFVELTFTPKASGLLELELDLSSETGLCPWHEFSDDHSIYIESSSPTTTKAFQSLANATIIIQ